MTSLVPVGDVCRTRIKAVNQLIWTPQGLEDTSALTAACVRLCGEHSCVCVQLLAQIFICILKIFFLMISMNSKLNCFRKLEGFYHCYCQHNSNNEASSWK